MAIFNNGVGLMARRMDHDGNLRSGQTKPQLNRIMFAKAGILQICWRKCSGPLGCRAQAPRGPCHRFLFSMDFKMGYKALDRYAARWSISVHAIKVGSPHTSAKLL